MVHQSVNNIPLPCYIFAVTLPGAGVLIYFHGLGGGPAKGGPDLGSVPARLCLNGQESKLHLRSDMKKLQ